MRSTKKLWHLIYLWLVIGLGFWLLYDTFAELNLNHSGELLVLIILMMLAEWLAVLMPQGKLSGGFAVLLTALMLFGVASAVWVTGLAVAFGQGIVNRGQPLRVTLFNATRLMTAVVGANIVYLQAGGRVPLILPAHIIPLLLFVLAYGLINRFLTYIYLFPDRRAYPPSHWLWVVRLDIMIYLLTIPIGLLMIFSYPRLGIYGTALLFMPVLAAQSGLRHYLHQASVNQMFKVCYTVCRQLNGNMNVKEMLELVLKEIYRLLPYHSGAIYLRPLGSTQSPVRAVYGPLAWLLAGSVLRPGDGFISLAMEDGVPQLVYDVCIDARTANEPGLLQLHRSLLLVPLVVRQHVVGILLLGDKRIGFFKEKHLQLTSIMAGQLASVLALAEQEQE